MDKRIIKIPADPSREECLSAIKMTLIRFNAFVQELDRQNYYSPGSFTTGHRDFLYEMSGRQYLGNMNAVLMGKQLEMLDDEALEKVLEKCRRLSDGFGLCVDIPKEVRVADGEEYHEFETYRKAKDDKGYEYQHIEYTPYANNPVRYIYPDGKSPFNAELKQGHFKERSWFSKNIDEPVEKFLARNFFGFGPADYVKLMDGTIVPMSESGDRFATSERNFDCMFFCASAFFSVFKLTKACNVISSASNEVKLNVGSQGKHLTNHPNYIEGRSILYGNVNDAQELINNFSGTGKFISENKERVNFGRVIGVCIDPKTNVTQETTWGIIHYGKNGAHIVPSIPPSY